MKILGKNEAKPAECYVYVYTEFNSKGIILIPMHGLGTDCSKVLFLTDHLYKTLSLVLLKNTGSQTPSKTTQCPYL